MNSSEKLSSVVENDEPLARYIFNKKHFSKENNRIKRQVFMPPPKNKDKISVIRHKNCLKDEILKIGNKQGSYSNRSLKAVGSIVTSNVRSINNLDVEADTSGGQHKRHANIKGFCNYTDAKTRDIAQKLANKTHLLYIL